MKLLLVVACFVGLVFAEDPLDFEAPITKDYHVDIGIPEAAAIKAAEESMDFGGSRIVGGAQVAALGQYPHIGGLVISMSGGGTSVCGSTLITNNRCVTAAHCWRHGNSAANSFTVVLGSLLLFSGGTRISTSNVFMHPSYNMNNLNNDIAIITISSVGFNNNIQSIARAGGTANFAGTWGWAAGWGRQSNTQAIGNAQRKHHVNLQVITNAVCASTYGTSTVVASVLCTSGAGGRGTCGGDSGGPFEVTISGTRALAGVTSFGHVSGCTNGFPAGFARITSFNTWINTRL